MPSVDSFNARLTSHLPRMRAYAVVLTRSETTADILLAQTAHNARQARGQAPIDGSFAAWMHRILRKTYIQSLDGSPHHVSLGEQIREAALSEESD